MHAYVISPLTFSIVSDKLSTGIAVADIDFSFIESVRMKMPVDKVHSSERERHTHTHRVKCNRSFPISIRVST